MVGVLRLASPDAAGAADALVTAEHAVAAAREALVDEIDRRLDALRSAGRWDDAASERKSHLGAIRAVRKGRIPSFDGDAMLERRAAALNESLTAAAQARTALEEAFDAAVRRSSRHLSEIAALPRFREAVLWQNRHAVRTALDGLARDPEPARRNSKRRQHEELVASYLQRYCLKNDTIGFFGPSGWGRFVDDAGLTMRPGEDLLAERRVVLESWTLEALAQTLEDALPVTSRVPRLSPYWSSGETVETDAGEVLRLVDLRGRAVDLAGLERAVVDASDGRAHVAEIVASLSAHAADAVLGALQTLVRRRILLWDLLVPVSPTAADALRAQLEGMPDEAFRAEALATLDRLETARDRVAAAAGDEAALDDALGALETTFSEVTGTAATRGGGRTYVGRTAVYEEARRDLELALGEDVVDRFAEPLGLVLQSCRWYCSEFSRFMDGWLDRAFEAAAEARGSGAEPEVSVNAFWYQILKDILQHDDAIGRTLRPELQARWAEIFGLATGPEGDPRRRIDLDSGALRARVDELFAAPDHGWVQAGCHSPDLMLAADGPEALRRGEVTAVLGELHMATNTLNNWVFMTLHPDREDVIGRLAADRPVPYVLIATPKRWPGKTTRNRPALFTARDVLTGAVDEIDLETDPGDESLRILRFADLVLRREDGRLVALDPSTRSKSSAPVRLDAQELFGDLISNMVLNALALVGPAAHAPRITIDDLVVSRERWTAPVAGCGFLDLKDELERFRHARAWARELGVPRFTFARVSVEKKPFFVDFEAPIYVEALIRMLRRARKDDAESTVSLTEMLPGPLETWVEDRDGARYCAELRTVVVDQRFGVGWAPVASEGDVS